MDAIFIFIGKVIAYGGGLAAFAYGIFMFLGQKWIETKFSEKLEEFKKEQERELEHYRHQINILFSRVSKIHEKEIEILPKIWKKLQDALGHVGKITSPLQYGPNFQTMTSHEFRDFVENLDLSDPHKKALIETSDKNTYYTNTIFWYNLRDAKTAVNDFHNFMLYNKIFLSKDLKQEFQRIDDLLTDALRTREIGEQLNDPMMIVESYEGLDENAKDIVSRIEKLVQERLEFTKAKPNENN